MPTSTTPVIWQLLTVTRFGYAVYIQRSVFVALPFFCIVIAKGMTGGFGAGFVFFGLLALLGFLGLAMVKVRWRTTWGAASGARV